jgi:hypothetical protein
LCVYSRHEHRGCAQEFYHNIKAGQGRARQGKARRGKKARQGKKRQDRADSQDLLQVRWEEKRIVRL